MLDFRHLPAVFTAAGLRYRYTFMFNAVKLTVRDVVNGLCGAKIQILSAS